jgi:hypothetical protein
MKSRGKKQSEWDKKDENYILIKQILPKGLKLDI